MRAGLRSLFSLGGTILVSNQPIRNAWSPISSLRFRAVWSILKLEAAALVVASTPFWRNCGNLLQHRRYSFPTKKKRYCVNSLLSRASLERHLMF